MNIRKYLLSTILVFCFISFAGITPILANESTEVTTNIENSIDNNEESPSKDINLEKEVEIQPNGYVGGGVATSEGHKGYAEIGMDVVAPGVRIQSAYITYTIYKNFGEFDPRNNSPYRTIKKNYYPNGKSFIEDEFNVNLSAGKYQLKVSGYMFSYDSSDIPLTIQQFWSRPFTVN
ncbi:hypothetical protein [Aquibacillus salsiterrae]|uniref:DUF4879 domain-containing protein n=1 Tax=Aquibacillus salsiterrae TaxID=2950439 RepID=A0A9X3WJI8_9BACI|nr:hypothetical protein [Aquibacillus salsiterrae]MDC3418504.1 hypothetical protein [Aquibacillus salsiterrae]